MRRFAVLLAVGMCAVCWAPPVERLGAQERGPIGIPMFRVPLKAIAAEVDGAAMSIVYGPPSMQGRTILAVRFQYRIRLVRRRRCVRTLHDGSAPAVRRSGARCWRVLAVARADKRCLDPDL